MNRIEKGSLLVLAIIVAFNIFFGLGSIPLLDPDEPVYAETAREMIQFNDYLSPRIYNEYWFDREQNIKAYTYYDEIQKIYATFATFDDNLIWLILNE